MIAQKYRFHGHGSLRYLYRHGDVERSRTLTVRYVHNPKREYPRLTVIVAKKVLKKAVKRNLIRRRVYEHLRLQLPRLKPDYDIAVTVFSPELLLASHDELSEQIEQILERAQLLR